METQNNGQARRKKTERPNPIKKRNMDKFFAIIWEDSYLILNCQLKIHIVPYCY